LSPDTEGEEPEVASGDADYHNIFIVKGNVGDYHFHNDYIVKPYTLMRPSLPRNSVFLSILLR
jgi:hypothetical protein